MDIKMPQHDGLDGLKKSEYDPNVAALVSDSINVEEKFEKYGTTAVFPKPFNMSKINEIVNRLCIHQNYA